MADTIMVAAVQAEVQPTLAAALDRTRELAADAVGRGARIIAFPETCEYVAPPVWDREIVLLAELQLRRSHEEAMTLDVTGHYHRGDVFDFAVRRGNRPAADAGAT